MRAYDMNCVTEIQKSNLYIAGGTGERL